MKLPRRIEGEPAREVHPLRPWLQRPAGRVQLRRFFHDALATLWVALVLSGLILGLGRLWPLPHWRGWAALPPILWAAVHLVRFLFLRPTAMHTARLLDRELGLKERLATALELEQRADRSLLAQIQQADALRHARQVDPARDLPWRIPRRALALAGGLLALALVLLLLPNPQDAILRQREAVRQAAREQAEQLEAVREEIAAMEGLSPEEREELLRLLDETTERLRRNPGDAGEAMADLEEFRRDLREHLSVQEERREAVDAVEAVLREVAGDVAQGDETTLEAALAGLEALPSALEEMSEEEIAELAAQAAELARRAAADPELARALEELAQALEEQDPEAVARATEAVTEALERAESEIAAQAQAEAVLEEALEALEAGEADLAQAGGESAEGAGGTEVAEGTGAGEGTSGEATGTGEGTSGGEDSTGEGGDWYQDPNRPHEEDAGPPGDTVYVPLGPDGQPVYIPGETAEGGETEVLPVLEPEPGEEGTAVPYDVVYRHYREAAGRAMERAYIPPGLRDYVRDYFSGLEP